MAAYEAMARRLRFAAGNLLLLAIAAVVISRAALLSGHGNILTARSEKRFFGWPYSDADLNVQLAAAAPRLADGEAVCLTRQPIRDPLWLRTMGIYFLPHQIVMVPGGASATAAPVCRRTVLLARPGRSLVLSRPPDAAFPQ
jgi:hypothetical protein